MIKIKNPWHQKSNGMSKEYFTFDKSNIKFTYKNGMILEIGKNDFLHCVNNKAFAELAGVNKELLKSVIDKSGVQNASQAKTAQDFLYIRAFETLNR